jgi:enoyl-CoA hydratase/carnithine racemase
MATSYETIEVTRVDSVVTITLNRPDRKNAINPTMRDELLDAVRSISGSRADRVVVLRGAGGTFCSGADVSGLVVSDERPHWIDNMRHSATMVQGIFDLPQPTIALVEGTAIGAGCNLALTCDLIIATDTAKFSQIFSRRGLSLDYGGSWSLVRRVGLTRAKELAFFGDTLDAAEALAVGLVNRVVATPDVEALLDEWCRKLLETAPIALTQTKQLLNQSFHRSFDEMLRSEGAAQAVNFSTADTAEVLTAFRERRPPTLSGR